MTLNVLVVGSVSADRTLFTTELLKDRIGRRGWGDRLLLSPAGLGSGAGTATAELALTFADLCVEIEVPKSCPSLDDRPELLGRAGLILAETSALADQLLNWDGSAGKNVLALEDFLGEKAVDLSDPQADLTDHAALIDGAFDELLRRMTTDG
jgi:hypothetical protein